jgi:hypothetical protein
MEQNVIEICSSVSDTKHADGQIQFVHFNHSVQEALLTNVTEINRETYHVLPFAVKCSPTLGWIDRQTKLSLQKQGRKLQTQSTISCPEKS